MILDRLPDLVLLLEKGAISDNGIGISNEVLQNQKGMGLNSMRYRAEFIEADFAVERGEEGGTVVNCIFDCENISSRIDSLYSHKDWSKSQQLSSEII